jgi:hypothetical protein
VRRAVLMEVFIPRMYNGCTHGFDPWVEGSIPSRGAIFERFMIKLSANLNESLKTLV